MSTVHAARCPRCTTECGEEARYCVRCGLELDDAEQAPATVPTPEDLARFVDCQACGATNAASRSRCGRCKVSFTTGEPPPDYVVPAYATPARPSPPPAEPASRVVFGLAITVAALAILGVMATVLSGNGIGFFAGALTPAEPEDGDVVLAVAAIRASSTLPGHDVDMVLDGDPSTAWREEADGDGVGEWVELELAGTPEVSRVLLWNGHQHPDRYDGTTRASQVRLELGERTFTADLLDVRGPQAVDLPELVAASSIRVTVLDVLPGDGDLAISGLEVRGPPPPAPDVDE